MTSPRRTREEILAWLDAARQRKAAWERETERELRMIAEDLDDVLTFEYLCKTQPEGLEMASEEEQAAFEKWLGL